MYRDIYHKHQHLWEYYAVTAMRYNDTIHNIMLALYSDYASTHTLDYDHTKLHFFIHIHTPSSPPHTLTLPRIHTHMHTHMHDMHAHIHTRIHSRTHTCTHARTHAHTHARMHAHRSQRGFQSLSVDSQRLIAKEPSSDSQTTDYLL